MATEDIESTSYEYGTLQRARSDFPYVSETYSSDLERNPFQEDLDYLGLIDIEAFAKLQLSISGPIGKSNHVGSPSLLGSLLLGEGGSFVVRRVSHSAFAHSIDAWDEPFDKSKGFVVVKQPTVHTGEPGEETPRKDFKKRLRDAMMELKVSYHEPLRKHPNIVKLHSFMWDTQSNLGTALAPSLIMEYADLGTVSDFQDSNRLTLHADAKVDLCLDVAEGLSFLHKCGVIHGDVKCNNIMLFRERVHDKHRATSIVAKVGDFGSALIGVFDIDCPKQRLPAHTNIWDAPEKAEPMDALSLRRMDTYSYGLAVWTIMCNGGDPYQRLSWDLDHKTIISEPPASLKTRIKEKEIPSMKQNGDSLLRLAIETLKGRPNSDIEAGRVQRVLEVTIRRDPAARASSFDDIVKLWGPGRVQACLSIPKPEPLKAGDFSVAAMNTKFPHFIYLIRTAPPSFRSLVCNQLSEYASSSPTDSQRALYHLALGVCHLQGFYSSGKKDLDSTGADPRALGVEQILSSAALGNPLAQSLAPSASASLSTHDRPDNNALQKWLVNAIRHGSIRARNEMNRLFPTEYIATIAYIKAKRFQLASLLKSSDDEAYGPKFFNQFSSLDPAAKAVLSQPGLSRLHQAAYLGALEVCKQLIEVRKLDVDILNLKKETPLHYAVRNGQLEVTQYLLDRGANINAQRDFGAGALHLAFLSYDTEAVLQLLLSKGADPHISSQSSLDEIPDRRDYLMGAAGTALHFAIRCGQIEAAKILLEVGSDPNKKFEFIFSPLQTAIQMHSMPLLEFIMPWAIKDVNNLPIVHDLYNPLVGFYAQPMFKWLYWGDETPLEFILPAVACIRRHRIGIDERVLLSWAFDSDDHRIVDHYLNKLLTKERHLLKPFRGPRVNDSGELTDSQDFPMAPDLRKVFSMILLVSSKQMIKTVLGYMDKPIPSCDETGQPLMCQLSFRQSELIGDVRAIVSMLIEAGVDITAIKLVSSQPNFGPLRNAAAWNNAVLAEVLLENHPSLAEVQGAMQVCVAKGNSKIARQIMRSIFEQCPQVLVVPLPSQEVFAQSQISQHDCNYLRAFCSRIEFSTKETLTAGALGEVIQYTKDQPGGQEALQERLAEIGLLKMTPLHHAAYSGNLDAAEILLGEGANVNAYHIFIHPGLGHDLSKATCTVDLSTLDDSQKLMLFGASGPTPLDEAYRRNWELALFQWLQSDQGLIKEIRWAGGACKEEDAYETRTQKMLEMLRAQGAKTRNELFGKPNTQEKATQMVLKKMRSRYEIKPLSDTSQRGSRFWGSACALHSAQTTQYKFPGLMNHSEPSRPRFSALFAESIEQFARVLSRCSELGEDETAFHVKEELSKYQTWARKNRIAEGDLDPIADIPPFGQSIVLAASLFVTLREVTYTLEYLEDIIMDSRDLIDRKYRYLELIQDLRKAVGVLIAEEIGPRKLSDSAVAEVEEKLQMKVEKIDLDGHLKP